MEVRNSNDVDGDGIDEDAGRTVFFCFFSFFALTWAFSTTAVICSSVGLVVLSDLAMMKGVGGWMEGRRCGGVVGWGEGRIGQGSRDSKIYRSCPCPN